ncbi:hypothetical protein [Pseudobacteroides cellulosolvens]|uniref:Uncharacterized protein n=1 Tax=Pseudobacteroides cellulosolvens ATCC 35603 = DSM 2933 TaxID=398512 RepID=A0A0L6JYN6_9FIRM|nr:hypothetical protein [Pseudobacteroides cellulosolvens]KNY30570.1 hypothetical protein Bccel_5850 [Pseudobacteroides cellulosolvens ATCC 35603 = DSM 2933]KNY30577.1 hypothetical protein Bccel_5857 [Pseudobacteroides cellulosolvens ATCC 35603 = DSM 2933]
MNHLFLISRLADGESTNYWMLIYFIPLFLFIFTTYFVINFFVFSLIKKHLDEEFKRLRNSFIISFTSLMCYPISVMAINIMKDKHLFLTFKQEVITFLIVEALVNLFIGRIILSKSGISGGYKMLIILGMTFLSIVPYICIAFMPPAL